MKLNKNIKALDTRELFEEFEKKGVLMLQDFFEENKEFKNLVEKKEKEKGKKHYDPLSHSYTRLEEEKLEELKGFLKIFLNRKIEIKSEWRSYKHKNFIILNDEQEKREEIIVILDFTKNWNLESGGKLVLTTKQEEILYLEPSFNTLTLINKDKELMTYLKYINNLSKGKRILRIEGRII